MTIMNMRQLVQSLLFIERLVIAAAAVSHDKRKKQKTGEETTQIHSNDYFPLLASVRMYTICHFNRLTMAPLAKRAEMKFERISGTSTPKHFPHKRNIQCVTFLWFKDECLFLQLLI